MTQILIAVIFQFAGFEQSAVRSGCHVVFTDINSENFLLFEILQTWQFEITLDSDMQLPASLGAFSSFFVDQITLAPLAVRQNVLLKSSGAEAHRDALPACKDGSCSAIFRKCQSTRVQMDANVFKDDFWQLQILVLYVFGTVGQQGLVCSRNGSHSVADELRTQFRYSFAYAVVAGVVQVETLP